MWNTERTNKGSDLRGSVFWVCEYNRVDFDGADLRECSFAADLAGEACTLRNVTFRGARLPGIISGFSTFEQCDFSNARFSRTNFDGSRLRNCKFAGIVNEVTFRRHARLATAPLFPWQHIDAMRFTNSMEGVDFSEANLRSVTFDGIDLSVCNLPPDANHLLIRDQHTTLVKAYQVIASTWPGHEAADILPFLDDCYITPSQGNPMTEAQVTQPYMLINRLDLVEWFGAICGTRLFDLLKTLSDTAPP